MPEWKVCLPPLRIWLIGNDIGKMDSKLLRFTGKIMKEMHHETTSDPVVGGFPGTLGNPRRRKFHEFFHGTE
jgi:hypothetical protein